MLVLGGLAHFHPAGKLALFLSWTTITSRGCSEKGQAAGPSLLSPGIVSPGPPNRVETFPTPLIFAGSAASTPPAL
jgi:hypothetical protein